MKDIPDGSVDMVLCDPPYGTTQCAWDKVIQFEPLWEQYKRIVKDRGAIVLFSSQPFTTDLISSNRKMFRYEIIWQKTQKSGFLNARKMPLRSHENICVFYKKLPTYNPQMESVERKDVGRIRKNSGKAEQVSEYRKNEYEYVETGKRFPTDVIKEPRVRKKSPFFSPVYGREYKEPDYIDDGTRFPTDVIKFSNWNGALFGKTDKGTKHPTQKPVSILGYLILTYTNEGDTVLDNCMGSGSTGVACVNTGRNFIGMELDEHYFQVAKDRIEAAQSAKT